MFDPTTPSIVSSLRGIERSTPSPTLSPTRSSPTRSPTNYDDAGEAELSTSSASTGLTRAAKVTKSDKLL
jgi:hypothetical protein